MKEAKIFELYVIKVQFQAMSHGSGSGSGSTTIRFDSGSNFPTRFE
jgi:hypothetical protein